MEATPFHRDAKTYCGHCRKWKEVEVTGFLKLGVSFYGFRCHNDYEEHQCDYFVKHNRVSGPQHKSFVAFRQKVLEKA